MYYMFSFFSLFQEMLTAHWMVASQRVASPTVHQQSNHPLPTSSQSNHLLPITRCNYRHPDRSVCPWSSRPVIGPTTCYKRCCSSIQLSTGKQSVPPPTATTAIQMEPAFLGVPEQSSVQPPATNDAAQPSIQLPNGD